MPFGRRKQTSDQSEPVRRFEFVGREKELKTFFDNLDLSSDAPAKKPIISISGVGGIGKTRFLQYIIQNLPSDYVYSFIDETDEVGDDIGRLINTICNNTRKSGKSVHFDKTDKLIRQRYGMLGQLQLIKEEVPKSIFEILYTGARLAVSATPVAPVMDLLDAKNKIVDAFTNLSNRALQRHNESVDLSLLLEPKPTLTKSFTVDINDICRGSKGVILFFDTFETVGNVISPWLLKYLIGENRDEINCNLHIVIAGRFPIKHTDAGWLSLKQEDLILDIDLNPFTDEEISNYVKTNCINQAVSSNDLAQITSRLPLWLELWALNGNSPETYRDILDLGNVTDRVLSFLTNDQQRHWAVTASVCNWFDADIFTILFGDDSSKAFDWIVRQSGLIKSSPNNKWKLHDVLQEILQRYLRTTSISKWNEINSILAAFVVERENQSMAYFDSLFLRYCDDDWKRAVEEYFVYSLKLTQIPLESRSVMAGYLLESLNYDLLLFFGLSDLLQKDGRGLLPNLLSSWRNQEFAQFTNDLSRINEELTLSSHQKAIAYNWIGYINFLQGHFTDALHWYSRALNEDSTLISAYYDRSDLYLKLKKNEKAHNDEILGRIYLQESFVRARENASRALKIFSDLSYRRATAALGYFPALAGGMGKTKVLSEAIAYFSRENILDTETNSSVSQLEKEISKDMARLKLGNPENLRTVLKKESAGKAKKQKQPDNNFGKKKKRKK